MLFGSLRILDLDLLTNECLKFLDELIVLLVDLQPNKNRPKRAELISVAQLREARKRAH